MRNTRYRVSYNIMVLIFFVIFGLANALKKIKIQSSPEIINNLINYNTLCTTELCVPKCCPIGQYLFGVNKKCIRKKSLKKTYNFSEVPLYYDNLIKSGRFLINVTLVPGRLLDEEFNKTSFDYSLLRHNYYITEEGLLYEEKPYGIKRWFKLNNSQYCVDYLLPMKIYDLTEPAVKFYIQFRLQQTQQYNDDPFVTIGFLVSCSFLALVLLVYAILRELRNLSGHVLMAYVASLMGAFMLLATIRIVDNSTEVCLVLSYCVYFLFMASFCWMNVMSYDIWWTFRGYAKAQPIHRRGETFKFYMYCIYAFGLPTALTSVVVVLNNLDFKHILWFIPPHSIGSPCFFTDDGKMLYLHVPMMILIVCNWIFFLMTAFNIWRLHRATAVLDSAAAGTPAAHRTQKYRFVVYLKLSVIMGINWLLEVLAVFSPGWADLAWYISDIYNALIGLIIFIMFVCKKPVLRKLLKRCQGQSTRM